jgi:hypothetical protein
MHLRVRPFRFTLTLCAQCIARHILSIVGRVAARDSSRTSASVQDLFVALCEDASIFGLFKVMKGVAFFVLSYSFAYTV